MVRLIGSRFNAIRGDYVRDNFLFYTRILVDFLQIAKKYDIYSAVRPASKVSRSKSYRPVKYIDMIDRVMTVFSDQKLLAHLQIMESALYSLEAYASNTTMSRRVSSMATPMKSSYRSSILGSSDRVYSNSGPLIRAQITFFEGKNDYVPVFIEVEGESSPSESVLDVVRSLVLD